jgi:hypothetical protein
MTIKKILLFSIIFSLALLLTTALFAQQGGSNAGLDRLVSQIESMFPPVEGYVIAVDGDVLTLDLKQGQAIQKGDRLNVIRYGKDIIHPVTKKKVGRKETDLGSVEVTKVRKDFSLGKFDNPDVTVQTGDGVQSPFQTLSFIIAPPKIETSKRVDADRLRLNLEDRLSRHPRFEVPSFDLGVWMLKNGLNRKTMLKPESLENLAGNVLADYILIPKIGTLKNKTVLSYQLFSTLDGTLQKQAEILSDQLPLAPKVARRAPRETEESVQGSFAPRREGLLKFVGKHEFSYAIVDFDVGDINGDGTNEVIVIDRTRIIIYKYENFKFKRIAQVKTPKGRNYFLGVDVGDINGNGRDEIFVTNQNGSELDSFVVEFLPGSKAPKHIWKNVKLYFRIVHPYDSKPTLLAQGPGFQDPFHGPINALQYKNNQYSEGREIKMPSVYGTEFILYGMTQTDLNANGLPDTILLDNEYHLRVYSAKGRMVVKSTDYYGHDPRVIDIGVKEDIAGIVTQGESVSYRGRLELVKTGNGKFLVLPRNHMFGGGILAKTSIVENCSIVILGVTQEGFEKVYETKKQRGYLSAYQVMDSPNSAGKQVHVATVIKAGLLGKETSIIYTYDWQNN